MNKSLIAFTLVLGATLLLLSFNNKSVDQFEDWKGKFGIKYTAEEETYRRGVFLKNIEEINHHNGLLGTTYKKGVNQFTVETQEEFAQKHLIKFPQTTTINIDEEDHRVGTDVDWVSYGAVSSVKNEGNCQANYAFSAIGAIEGANYIWNRSPVEYSVQQVIDCTTGYGNNGCSSGRMDNTFLYVKNRGINLWSNYTYVGYQQYCKASPGIFKIGGYGNATGCSALQAALLNQPVSVAVDGSNFASYTSGIISRCGTNLSLAVLLVGMTDISWRVKLSWGTTFGEEGYVRLARGNTCGICNQPSYPTK